MVRHCCPRWGRSHCCSREGELGELDDEVWDGVAVCVHVHVDGSLASLKLLR